MSVQEKIAAKREEMERDQARATNGRYKKERDIFLLWGEYPKGWHMIKDFILCLMLLDALIGHLKQLDLTSLMAQNTITIVNEVAIKPAEASETTQPLESDVVTKNEGNADDTEVAKIVAKVRRLESSGGKNDGCLSKGKVNGYGYAQNKTSWVCYNSHEEVKKLVEGWFEQRFAEGMDIATATCYYNTGIKTNQCEYYEKYKSL